MAKAVRISGIVYRLAGPNWSISSATLPSGVGSTGPRSATPTTPRTPVAPGRTGARLELRADLDAGDDEGRGHGLPPGWSSSSAWAAVTLRPTASLLRHRAVSGRETVLLVGGEGLRPAAEPADEVGQHLSLVPRMVATCFGVGEVDGVADPRRSPRSSCQIRATKAPLGASSFGPTSAGSASSSAIAKSPS